MTGEGERLRFTVLGCGSSPGTPRPNGDWGNCDPQNPKNRRLRASLLVEQIAADGETTTVIIDTGPDFRQQMIAAAPKGLDAVIYTHPHADHIHGIDDLRTFVIDRRKRMDIYADASTLARLRQGFAYCFETPSGSSYPPILDPHEVINCAPITIEGKGGALHFRPLKQIHGDIHSLGFRMGNVAYCPDVSAFPHGTLEQLRDLDVLIIDALQYRPHPSHFSLSEALDVIETVKPKRAYLTHMHTPLDYGTVLAETPECVEPAYDGLTFEVVL